MVFDVDGDALVLVPRVYVGGILFGALMAVLAFSANLVALALVLLVWSAVRAAITSSRSSALVPSLASKSAAILNPKEPRTRVAVEPTSAASSEALAAVSSLDAELGDERARIGGDLHALALAERGDRDGHLAAPAGRRQR